MKLGEAIQRVQSLYSRGVQSRSSRLTSRHTYSALLSARALLLQQQHNKNQKATQWVYQTIPCVELVKVPLHECPCVPPDGCMMLKSKYRLPLAINGLDSMLVQSITSLDGAEAFDLTRFDLYKYAIGRKYTSKKPDAFVKEGFLYITALKQRVAVTIVGLFYDFLEVKDFPSVCGECLDCECLDIMEFDFPLDANFDKALIQLANEELIVIMKQMTEDKTNNSSDDTSSSGAMVHQPNQEQ